MASTSAEGRSTSVVGYGGLVRFDAEAGRDPHPAVSCRGEPREVCAGQHGCCLLLVGFQCCRSPRESADPGLVGRSRRAYPRSIPGRYRSLYPYGTNGTPLVITVCTPHAEWKNLCRPVVPAAHTTEEVELSLRTVRCRCGRSGAGPHGGLEKRDAIDRFDGTAMLDRPRQVPAPNGSRRILDRPARAQPKKRPDAMAIRPGLRAWASRSTTVPLIG